MYLLTGRRGLLPPLNPNPCSVPRRSGDLSEKSPWENRCPLLSCRPASTRVTLAGSSLSLWEYFRGAVTLASQRNSLCALEIYWGYWIPSPLNLPEGRTILRSPTPKALGPRGVALAFIGHHPFFNRKDLKKDGKRIPVASQFK